VTRTAVAVVGPRFRTAMEYRIVAPSGTDVGAVFSIERSALVTSTCAVALLFPSWGSRVPLLTTAVSGRSPATPGRTRIVTDAPAPASSCPRSQTTAPPFAQDPADGDAERSTAPSGMAFVIWTARARCGPAF
jgi:hypothetical protein